jgi:integrase
MIQPTVREFAAAWRSGSGGRYCSDVWARDRRRKLQRFLALFGDRPIASITALEIWEVQRSTLAAGCSAATANRLTASAMAMLRDAEHEGVRPRHSHQQIQRDVRYMRENPAKKYRPWTESERDEILDLFRLHQPPWFPAVAFNMYTGVRISETAALDWEQVHLRERTAYICASWTDGVPGACKTRRSVRPVKLATALVDILEFSAPAHRTGPVFAGPRGGRLRSQNFNRRVWYPTLAKGRPGLPIRPPRCSRHTFVSGALSVLPTADVARQTGDRIEQLERAYHQHTREFALLDIDAAIGAQQRGQGPELRA